MKSLPLRDLPAYDPLLPAPEAAEYLGLHVETLRLKARLREIASIRDSAKRGSPVKFRLSELNKWASRHEIKARRGFSG